MDWDGVSSLCAWTYSEEISMSKKIKILWSNENVIWSIAEEEWKRKVSNSFTWTIVMKHIDKLLQHNNEVSLEQ